MNAPEALINHIPLHPGSHLYSTSLGNLLIGCPPEVLKLLMQLHLPMPDTIVIPGTRLCQGSSLAALEFPFYHFLFIQRGLAQGKRFRVLAKKAQCSHLETMLRVTLVGPELDEALQAEAKLGLSPRLEQERVKQVVAETRHLALKSSQGKMLLIKDLIDFVPFETGDEITLYPALDQDPPVKITRLGENEFQLFDRKNKNCKLTFDQPLTPSYPIKAAKVASRELHARDSFSVRLLGVSEAFSPSGPANGVLIRAQGKWILWDAPAFLREHLAAIGLALTDLDALFISHVHEDHLDVAQTLVEGKKLPLYSSPEIYHSLLLKLMALKDISYAEAHGHYEFHPVYARQPFDLFGATAEVFYSLHSIPALGLRLAVPHAKGEKNLFISGDHLPQRMIQTLKEAGVLSQARLAELDELNPAKATYDLVLVDAGSGIIHGDPADYFANPNPVNYMHTGKAVEGQPSHHFQAKQGHRFVLYP